MFPNQKCHLVVPIFAIPKLKLSPDRRRCSQRSDFSKCHSPPFTNTSTCCATPRSPSSPRGRAPWCVLNPKTYCRPMLQPLPRPSPEAGPSMTPCRAMVCPSSSSLSSFFFFFVTFEPRVERYRRLFCPPARGAARHGASFFIFFFLFLLLLRCLRASSSLLSRVE